MSVFYWQLLPDEQTDTPKYRNWTGNPNPKPYKCPRCNGGGVVWENPPPYSSHMGYNISCPACNGIGVLWG